MSTTQPLAIVLTPETILDLYLEYGMPQGVYDQLSKVMDATDKESLVQITLIGLDELSGKMSLEMALCSIMLAVFDLSNADFGK